MPPVISEDDNSFSATKSNLNQEARPQFKQ